jgi:enoyl-CoA hydratase/carnithine racemase
MKPLVRLENAESIGIVTLDHPEKRNALSRAMLAGLRDHLLQIAEDRNVRVVVLRAEGPVFSSGHDLSEMANASREQCTELFALCTEVMERIRQLPQPVIAEVQGLATAAGCQLAASCDLVMAAENASFATPGVKIGLFCTTPGVALSRAIPAKKALEMLFTGAPISAAEAERVGLVNHVVAANELRERTLALARQIAQASSSTVALGKRAFYAQIALDRPAAYALAQRVMTENAATPDAQEGIRAFLEKRTPQWRS